MFASMTSSDPGVARELSTARARLADQERQIQELNHRVANSLQLAADMLIFEQLRARDPLAQAALEASRARLVAVGELHRYLHDHADRMTVELRPFFTDLGRTLSASTGLDVRANSDSISVDGPMAQQLAIAANELAINAAKHAYEGQPGGRLDINCRREGQDLLLVVSDFGKGLATGQAAHSGLGMSIVAAIVRDLKGAMTVRSDGGATFTIRAPIPAPPAPKVGINRSFQSWGATERF
jgi:two-component sensor histidine kinase